MMRVKKRDENTWQAMTKTNYTFGDSDKASLRLRNLANLYEPGTRSLLKRSEVDRPRLAIDLGCGPGWSTGLIREILNPQQTVGLLLESSLRRIASGMENAGIVLNTALFGRVWLRAAWIWLWIDSRIGPRPRAFGLRPAFIGLQIVAPCDFHRSDSPKT